MLIHTDWYRYLEGELEKDYFKSLIEIVRHSSSVVPSECRIFRALELTPLSKVKCVIIGQDPYFQESYADGLAFSTSRETKVIPASLRNIYREMVADIGIVYPKTGNLDCLAERGVLLLNTVLTTRIGVANAHRGIGWEIFTNKIIEICNHKNEPIVFVLWGKSAQEKKLIITSKRHLVIESVHPSPNSANRGFFGSKPFSRVNVFLESEGRGSIDWSIK